MRHRVDLSSDGLQPRSRPLGTDWSRQRERSGDETCDTHAANHQSRGATGRPRIVARRVIQRGRNNTGAGWTAAAMPQRENT
eukprot:15456870-Alexandrium_andersonii.AAC.1